LLVFCRDGVRGGILSGNLSSIKQPKAVYDGASGVNRTASQAALDPGEKVLRAIGIDKVPTTYRRMPRP
jgi:hypothetical protein